MQRRRVVAMARPCRRVKMECSTIFTWSTSSPSSAFRDARTPGGNGTALPIDHLMEMSLPGSWAAQMSAHRAALRRSGPHTGGCAVFPEKRIRLAARTAKPAGRSQQDRRAPGSLDRLSWMQQVRERLRREGAESARSDYTPAAHDERSPLGGQRAYFPMQKLLKIRPSRSSLVNSPVISLKAR